MFSFSFFRNAYTICWIVWSCYQITGHAVRDSLLFDCFWSSRYAPLSRRRFRVIIRSNMPSKTTARRQKRVRRSARGVYCAFRLQVPNRLLSSRRCRSTCRGGQCLRQRNNRSAVFISVVFALLLVYVRRRIIIDNFPTRVHRRRGFRKSVSDPRTQSSNGLTTNGCGGTFLLLVILVENK